MLSIEIIRKNKNLPVTDLIRMAGISKQAYYNAINPEHNISDAVLQKIGSALSVPTINKLYLIDRLYLSEINITDLEIPDSVPGEIRELLYKEHPLFIHNKSKYNRLISQAQ